MSLTKLQDSLNDLKTYLTPLQIASSDKRYVMNFCKKTKYLESLRDKLYKDTQESITPGYGNANSKICLVFNNPERFKTVKPFIQEQMDSFKINFWDVWTTFINKTKCNYPYKFELLGHEINAIGPKCLYVFTDDDSDYDNVMQYITNINANLLDKHFNIRISDFASQDMSIKRKLWYDFHYFINYQS